MKAYIVGGGTGGTEEYSGVYHLVTADGVCWATQWCSSFAWARKDLYEDREGLKDDWKKKYGEVEVLRMGEDNMTFDQLLANELNYVPAPEGKMADGQYYSILTVKDGQVINKTLAKPLRALSDLLVDAIAEDAKKSRQK